MKRPPGLWILLSAGVLLLSLQEVYGIRATALIFGRSTTSTTTTTEEPPAQDRIDEETATNTPSNNTADGNITANGNSTGPVLTGIPQIDYIWDPNLPQELRGYNLSNYPFYERVPVNIDKEIDFKCDGLHDGFYASIPHKCQVYHHCLFGTRFDFLCANYTAFDQKTFICHFVSEVDCVNSKKYWHRNDALYQAASTTTSAPLRNIYTTAPPEVGEPITPRRAVGGGARRPYRPRRRRPQFEYYDDEYYDEEYYDERPRSTRRKRPRPRPRPIYEDEEDYEEERYESKRGGSRRRPYRKRNKDRKKIEYDDEDEEVDDRFEDEDFIAARKRQKNDEKRKPPPAQDEELEERDPKRPNGKRRYPNDQREQESDYNRKPPRKNSSNRRPVNDDYDDEIPQSDDSRNYEQRPRKKSKTTQEESVDGRPIIKPATGTIYDRPRLAPRINPPVPKNAADKFAFRPSSAKTTTTTKATPPAEDEEYLDEEYEEPLSKRPRNRNRRPPSEKKREKVNSEDSREQPSESRYKLRKPEVEESTERPTNKPKYGSVRNRFPRPTQPSKRRPVSEEYIEEEEYLDEVKEVQDKRPPVKFEKRPTSTTTSTTTTTTTTTSTTTTTTPAPKKEPLMRIIKRPFLPSRGGSPYSSRGLQPIGLKAIDKLGEENESKEGTDLEKSNVNTEEEEEADYYEDRRSKETIEEKPVRESQEEVQNARKPFFKPSPVLIKVPIRQKYVPPSAEAQELIDSEPSYQQNYKTRDFVNSRPTQKPKAVEKNPLDLNEYDVTLNDALNPTLPNLPVRAFPTGFSSSNDYSYNTFTRPRYVLEPIITPSNQNYINQNKVVRSHQRYETVPQNQYSTINGLQRQPGQTQAIYSSY